MLYLPDVYSNKVGQEKRIKHLMTPNAILEMTVYLPFLCTSWHITRKLCTATMELSMR